MFQPWFVICGYWYNTKVNAVYTQHHIFPVTVNSINFTIDAGFIKNRIVGYPRKHHKNNKSNQWQQEDGFLSGSISLWYQRFFFHNIVLGTPPLPACLHSKKSPQIHSPINTINPHSILKLFTGLLIAVLNAIALTVAMVMINVIMPADANTHQLTVVR